MLLIVVVPAPWHSTYVAWMVPEHHEHPSNPSFPSSSFTVLSFQAPFVMFVECLIPFNNNVAWLKAFWLRSHAGNPF